MEAFSALLALCAGNSPVTGEFPSQALMFSLICAWTNDWVNDRDAGDLRHHRAHYDAHYKPLLFTSLSMSYACRVNGCCKYDMDVIVLWVLMSSMLTQIKQTLWAPTKYCLYLTTICDRCIRGHFLDVLWASNWNLTNFLFLVMQLIQSGNKFALVTTAQLSWHVQNCDLIWSLIFFYGNPKFSKIWVASS